MSDDLRDGGADDAAAASVDRDARARTRARIERVFRTMLIVSLLAHSFFLPTPWTKALLALSVATSSKDLSLVALDDDAVLPMEIELLAAAPAAAPAPPPATPGDGVPAAVSAPAAASSAPGPKPLPDAGRKDEPVDAGRPDAAIADAGSDAGEDAGADGGVDGGRDPDASVRDAGLAESRDASTDAAPVASARRTLPDAGDGSSLDAGVASGAASGQPPLVPPIRDPIGIAGKAGAIAGKDPNVSILLSMDSIRAHPAGADLGPVFAVLPIWKQFFVGSGVDPVKDLDRILVAGPQFRESSKVVAVVKLKLSEDKIRAVLEGIRQRATPPGTWESESLMLATVDGTPRVFSLQGNGVLLVVPESLGETARKMKNAGFPGTKNEAVVVFLKSPGKALRGAPFTIPTSLKWVRLATTLAPDGSATARIDCLDDSTEAAQKSAEILTVGLELATTTEVPLLGKVRMIDPVVFQAVGDHVQGTVKLNPAQARELGRLVARGAANLGGPPPSPAKPAGSLLRVAPLSIPGAERDGQDPVNEGERARDRQLRRRARRCRAWAPKPERAPSGSDRVRPESTS
jgi:hypothetical protein